jgi:hypothetical protein
VLPASTVAAIRPAASNRRVGNGLVVVQIHDRIGQGVDTLGGVIGQQLGLIGLLAGCQGVFRGREGAIADF